MGIFCDFCDKNERDAKDGSYIAAPGAKTHICETCVDTCAAIIEEARIRKTEKEKS